MDEVERTLATYEGNAEAYAEKYLSESGLEAYGGPFLDALRGERVLDLGCGPGVDAAAFAGRGTVATTVGYTYVKILDLR